MIRIPVIFALYSTYGWLDFEAFLEERDGRAVLVVPEDPARKAPFQGVYVPEQRFPDFWNDTADPRLANVEPTREDGVAFKQITVWSPVERGGEPKPRVVKAFPYIHSASVGLTHLHVVRPPTGEEREWLATKAFPEAAPHFRPGHQTIESTTPRVKARGPAANRGPVSLSSLRSQIPRSREMRELRSAGDGTGKRLLNLPLCRPGLTALIGVGAVSWTQQAR